MIDDTAAAALRVSEAMSSTVEDVASVTAAQFDESSLWRSGFIKLSFELAQDTAVDLDSFFSKVFGIRFARGIGAEFISTLLGTASVGATALGDSNAASPDPTSEIGFPDLLSLLDSVDSAYTESPGAAWLMRRSTLTKISALSDRQGLPIRLTGFQDGQFNLLGFPVKVCPSMPAIASSAKTVAFGDLERFVARSVAGSFKIAKYLEKYADYGEFAVEGFWRVDGTLTDTNAIKFLQQG